MILSYGPKTMKNGIGDPQNPCRVRSSQILWSLQSDCRIQITLGPMHEQTMCPRVGSGWIRQQLSPDTHILTQADGLPHIWCDACVWGLC